MGLDVKEEKLSGDGTVRRYRVLTAENRPKDPSFKLKGWVFECAEYGGEFPDMFPLVIRGTDPEGRTCSYHPLKDGDGKMIDFMSLEITQKNDDGKVIEMTTIESPFYEF